MIKSGLWTKLLPALGVVLATVLAVAATLLFLEGRGGGGTGDVGGLIAVTQAVRVDARSAVGGESAAFDALTSDLSAIETSRRVLAANAGAGPAVRGLVANADEWQTIARSLADVVSERTSLQQFHAARVAGSELVPQLLAATANLVSALSPADLRANQSQLERFELTVESIRQDLRALAVPVAVAESAQRLSGSERYLDQIIRGLRGEDSGLGLVSVSGRAAAASLDEATALFSDARGAIASLLAASDGVAAATAALDELDAAADSLLARYRSLELGSAVVGGRSTRLPLIMVGAALFVLLLMMVAYHRARDFRRAAQAQSEQNERNQQAILRLLDELSNLADGDLTVEATVTEDITGAIADSINYAIEALRELVATVNDSSILVDAAAKQTEATSRHLVRSSETQSRQAAAASESIAQMTASVEEVSGNAERCSDVARHAVDVAHKGGEAVRRTIDGMNTIRETIQDTSKRIKRLGESSQEIGNIVELIEEIAEQTNILALNASIEASRAGESSRGFAVVADEVQKLAERSANATRKIEVLVSTIQSDTNEAVVSMERSTTDVVGGALLAENAGAALDEIEQVSHQIASLVQNISSSARDQSSVSVAINKNMQVLRDISTKTKESTTATSSAISKLSELASQLRHTVSGFTLPDHATATGVLSPRAITENLGSVGADALEDVDLPMPPAQRRLQSG
jgi:twitching motility protein PilJ